MVTPFGRKHPPSEMAAVGHSVWLFVCCDSCLVIEFSVLVYRSPKNKKPMLSVGVSMGFKLLQSSLAYIMLPMPGVVGSIPCLNEMG
jgi:hypothetical protein